jgi:alpha-ketoglutarate-dependent taurine dioxygenase
VTTTDVKSKWASRKTALKPQAVSAAQEDWVRTSLPVPGRSLPLLVEPALRGVDLCEWVRHNREWIGKRLLQHGGLLFRNFGLCGNDDFQRVLAALDAQLVHYMEGATPRTRISDKIYSSTEFPADQTIAPHNELNYVKTWPMKIWFFCVTAAAAGGETPIVDVRKVYQRLAPDLLAPFLDKGWMLARNFGDGFGLTWQSSYRVETREELEAYFRTADIEWEWKDGDRVRSHQVRPAVARHLQTGEMVWFNHIAFWHVSSLEPKLRGLLLEEFGEEGLPYNTYYGDGSRIPDEVVEQLRRAYDAELVAVPWQEGDLMMLDNMLAAHGRNPFKGPRKIITAMAESCSDRNL